MRAVVKRMTAVFIGAALLATLCTVPAQAQDRFEARDLTPESMAADAVIVRPLGICATALGTALWFVGLPFAAFGGNAEESFKTMVGKPAKFTFERPLGDF